MAVLKVVRQHLEACFSLVGILVQTADAGQVNLACCKKDKEFIAIFSVVLFFGVRSPSVIQSLESHAAACVSAR